MKDFLYSILIAFSFFTTIPMPLVEWTSRRMRFLPLLMPAVGLVIGIIGFWLYSLLVASALSTFTKAVIMVLFYLVITGGLHMDGLMDTADAYFSRQSRERRLEIMKDSRMGAFAVMTFVCLMLVKVTCFYELFRLEGVASTVILLLLIPVLSRIVQALMLCLFPYAKEDGLAVMYGEAARGSTPYILGLYFVLTTVIIYLLSGFRGLILPLGLLLFCVFYYFSTRKNFGGITGDIVGGFVELGELLMLIMLLIV
jgi:adenosylcobinamide-GDP ribazoletransferase